MYLKSYLYCFILKIHVLIFFKNTRNLHQIKEYSLYRFAFFFDMLWQLLLTMKFYVSLQTKTLVKPDDQLDLNDQVNKLCTLPYKFI